MKLNELKAGSVLSYVQMGLGVLIGILYTPVMLRLLGKSEYGLYNTVASTISMLSVLSLGFNSSYIRYYAKYKAADDKPAIHRLNGMFLLIFIVIGVIALACGTFLAFHLDIVFDEGLTAEEYRIARVLMILLTVNLAVSFPMSVFSSIISAHERYVYLKVLSIAKNVLGPLVTLPLLLMGYRSIAMVAVTVIIALITDVLYLYYALRVLKQRFVFRGFEKGLFKGLFLFTSFIAINIIVDQINWNVGKILLGRFRGTEAVAVYSVGYTLYTYYQLFSTSVSGVFTPRIHRIVNAVQDRREQGAILTELIIKIGRIQFLILALIASGLIFFGKRFIVDYWAGAGYEDSYAVTLLLALPATIALVQNIGIDVQRARNEHQFRSLVYLGMALINIVLTVFLCQEYGAVGAAIGTAISLVLANGIVMNIYYHKRCDLNMLRFWKSLAGMLPGLIPPVFAGILLNCFWDSSSTGMYLASIVLYVLVYCISVWLFSMNSYERDIISRPVLAVVKRLKSKGGHLK